MQVLVGYWVIGWFHLDATQHTIARLGLWLFSERGPWHRRALAARKSLEPDFSPFSLVTTIHDKLLKRFNQYSS
jgi:hypothetical protein